MCKCHPTSNVEAEAVYATFIAVAHECIVVHGGLPELALDGWGSVCLF